MFGIHPPQFAFGNFGSESASDSQCHKCDRKPKPEWLKRKEKLAKKAAKGDKDEVKGKGCTNENCECDDCECGDDCKCGAPEELKPPVISGVDSSLPAPAIIALPHATPLVPAVPADHAVSFNVSAEEKKSAHKSEKSVKRKHKNRGYKKGDKNRSDKKKSSHLGFSGKAIDFHSLVGKIPYFC